MNLPLTCANLNRVAFKVYYYLINLFVLYALEYSCFGYLLKSAVHGRNKQEGFLNKYQYEIIFIFFQLGVFVSRGSLDWVKIPYLNTMNFLMLILFCCWVVFAIRQNVDFFVLIGFEIAVGLLAGF